MSNLYLHWYAPCSDVTVPAAVHVGVGWNSLGFANYWKVEKAFFTEYLEFLFRQKKKPNKKTTTTQKPTKPDLSGSGERNCFPTSRSLTLCFNEKAFLLLRWCLVAVLGLNWIQLWPWMACWESLTSRVCVPTDASWPEKWNCSCFSFLPLEILNNQNFGRRAEFLLGKGCDPFPSAQQKHGTKTD